MTATRRRPPAMDARIRERRREVARERARRRRRIGVSVALAAVLAAGAVGATYTPLFEVDDVRVAGAAGEQEQEVRGAAGVTEGERLLAVDLDQTAADVEALPWVRTASVSRQPPSTVEIHVEPREPTAVVHAGDGVWVVDGEGVVLAGGAPEALVVIEAPQALVPGTGERIADAAVRNALATHRDLPPELRDAVRRYEAPSERGLRALLDGEVLDVAPADGLWVRLGTAEHVPAKAQVITVLLEQLDTHADRLGEDPIAELDVRAPDNPVVVPEG